MNASQASAIITVDFALSSFVGEAKDTRPGVAITKAIMNVMRQVKMQFPGAALETPSTAFIRVDCAGHVFEGTAQGKRPGAAMNAAIPDIMPKIRKVAPRSERGPRRVVL